MIKCLVRIFIKNTKNYLKSNSGAGKSTLMNALAHRTPGEFIVDGDILVNGHRATQTISSMSGYVHQDDLFVGSLTCREHLMFMVRPNFENFVVI